MYAMRLILPFAALLVLLTGCARVRVTTEIKTGGAFTRSVALTGQEKKENQMNLGDSIEDDFVLPADGWKSTKETKDSNVTTTFTRTFALGTPVKGDLTIKEDGKPSLVNEVSITRLGPKRFEYRETLRWVGAPSSSIKKVKPEDLAKLKAALPPALATDQNANALADKLSELALPMLFGPGDPLLTMGLIHPDLAARRLSQRIGGLMIKALEDQFGDKMTPGERRAVVLKMVDSALTQVTPSQPDPSAGPPSSSKGGGLVPLMFVVKTPGKIVTSNGEIDQLTGEAFWGLFPPAAMLKPVVLTAIVEVE
jgi:hypothetical protein